MIQKRTTTWFSFHPLSSKWWWIGAIGTRAARQPNDATWITDSVSTTNTPPMMKSTISCRTITAMVPGARPRERRHRPEHFGRIRVEPEEAEAAPAMAPQITATRLRGMYGNCR